MLTNQPPDTSKRGARSFLSQLLGKAEISVLIPLVVIILIAQSINKNFLSWDNVTSIMRSSSFIAIIALGMTFVFITRELDLSVGSVVALSSMVTGLLLTKGVGWSVAIMAGILSGFVCGLITGFLIVKFNIPAMIGSLGTQFIFRGIVFVVTEGLPLYPMPEGFEKIGLGNTLFIPNPVIVYIILAVILAFVLSRTVYGRSVYAIGGNADTAWLCGINVNLIRQSTYWIVGALAGLVGVLLTSRLSSAQPSAGTTWEMNVIASVVVGGTSTFGGIGTILGTVLGSILIGMLTNVLVLVKISAYWQNIAIGTIIVLSVIFDQYRKRRAVIAARARLKQ